MNQTAEQSRKNRKMLLILSGLVVGMFGFGFALVPLYDLYCKAVGINKIESVPQLSEQAVVMAAQEPQLDREVTVSFDVNVRDGLPWDFEAVEYKVTVHPGQKSLVKFRVRNRAQEAVVGQAIPAVTPWQATPYLAKLECFCFNKQELQPGEEVEMPLYFVVSPDIPEEMESMVLSYTFMNIDKDATEKYGGNASIAPAVAMNVER
jgi:cytochrome c oxidase assembly protein subunit 11